MKGTYLQRLMQGYGKVVLTLTFSCKADVAIALPRYLIAETMQKTDDICSAYVRGSLKR